MNTLVKRTLSGIIFVFLMVAGILLHPLSYAVLMVCCIGIMVVEFYRMVLGEENKVGQILGFATCILLFVCTYLMNRYGMMPSLWSVCLLPVLMAALWISVLFNRTEYAPRTGAWLFLPILYISIPFSCCNFLVFSQTSGYEGWPLLGLFILLWASDVGGYVIGMLFGQKHGHKLWPRISPKKSWEGFVGSVVFSLVAGYVLYEFQVMPYAWYHCLILALLVCLFGVFGDLTESEIKRFVGVKDAGHIMPGHGGLMDRFDGALLAFPVAVAYISFITFIL